MTDAITITMPKNPVFKEVRSVYHNRYHLQGSYVLENSNDIIFYSLFDCNVAVCVLVPYVQSNLYMRHRQAQTISLLKRLQLRQSLPYIYTNHIPNRDHPLLQIL